MWLAIHREEVRAMNGQPMLLRGRESANAAISPLRRRKVRDGFGRDDKVEVGARKRALRGAQGDIFERITCAGWRASSALRESASCGPASALCQRRCGSLAAV